MAAICAAAGRQLRLRRRDAAGGAAVLERFLRRAHRFQRLGLVEVVRPDRGVGEHRHARGLHFEEAALHVHELVGGVARQLDAHGAGTICVNSGVWRG
jgi:hypothetical protein